MKYALLLQLLFLRLLTLPLMSVLVTLSGLGVYALRLVPVVSSLLVLVLGLLTGTLLVRTWLLSLWCSYLVRWLLLLLSEWSAV